MPNARKTATNKSIRAKADREYKQCRDQIRNRLKASPAQIIELDTLGFPIQTVSRALVALQHEGFVKNRGFIYFLSPLRSPVGAVSNRTASAQLETVPTKRENSKGSF